MSKLKEKRLEKGFSQKQLADLVGISLRTVQEYEQGNRDINKCQAIKVYNICKILDCDIKDILEFDS